MSDNRDLDLALEECLNDVRARMVEAILNWPADRPAVMTARFQLHGPHGETFEGTLKLAYTPAPSDRPAARARRVA